MIGSDGVEGPTSDAFRVAHKSGNYVTAFVPPTPFQLRFQGLLRGGALVSEARNQALREMWEDAAWASVGTTPLRFVKTRVYKVRTKRQMRGWKPHD